MNQNEVRSNPALGILGALLGAIAGAVIYYIVTKLGYIAWISSIAGVSISLALYTKFAKKMSWIGVLVCVLLNVAVIFMVDSYIKAEDILSNPAYRDLGYSSIDLAGELFVSLFQGKYLDSYVYSFISGGISLVVGFFVGLSQMSDQKKGVSAAAQNEEATAESESAESGEYNHDNDPYRNDRYDSEESKSNDSLDSNLGSLDNTSDTSSF